MEQVCRSIIGGFRDAGHCEFVEEFARVFPITIFIEMYGLPIERREALGVTDNLVRFSVGVEDVADLRADIEAALV